MFSPLFRCVPRSWRRQMFIVNTQTYNVIQLAIGFFLIFSAFNSSSFIEETVISSVADQGGKVTKHSGYISLAIVYGFFTFCNFLAAPVTLFLGARWSLVLGGITYTLFQVGFLFLNTPFLYISSALLGFGAAVIWTAQGNYLTLNSTEETAAKHSGIFWAISQACLSCGGLFLFFVFNTESETISQSTMHIIYGVFTAVSIAGTVLLALLRMPSNVDDTTEISPSLPPPTQEAPLTQLELLKSTLQLCKTKRMLLLIVAFMYTGLQLSFWSGIYPSCIAFTKQLASNTKPIVALNAITQGLGQATGGFLFGLLSSKTSVLGRDKIVMLGTTINMVVFAGIYLNFPQSAPLHSNNDVGIIRPQAWLALICGYLLGFADACWNTQIFTFLISNYPKQSAQAFSLFKFWQSLLTCFAFFYGTVFNLNIQLLMLVVGSLVGCICFKFAEQLSSSETSLTRTDVHTD
ncbi:UNC93-like protein MFSD11 [Aphelenchoides bicaudatus]|nr:UNC93-like protein MFSD11 [Aphelenchoides bicaudatus]